MALVLCLGALAGCDGDVPEGMPSVAPTAATTDTAPPAQDPDDPTSSADQPTAPTSSAGPSAPTALPSPDGTVPDDPSGYGTYEAADASFSLDIPAGWFVTLGPPVTRVSPSTDLAMLDADIAITERRVDGPDLDTAMEGTGRTVDEGEPVDVPGAAEAVRVTGASWAPYDLVVAVDAEGNVAQVLVFDDGGLGDDEVDHVVSSLQFPSALG